MYDFLVVGAGFAGSVLAERLARIAKQRVLIIDRRAHVAGNAFDYKDDAGILVHKYGPHIFHTNSDEVFQYLSTFTQWRPYEHRVLTSVDGALLPMPINVDTVNRYYGTQLDAAGAQAFLTSIAEIRKTIKTSEDFVVSRVGRELYEKFFRNYTRKQWGLDPSELDASVAARVPVRFNHDDRYFTDRYQAMPTAGYTPMFQTMLDHRRIEVQLNTDYRDVLKSVKFNHLVFTGPIDEYFNFRYGKLEYRSLRFEHKTYKKKVFQPAAVVNFPNEHDYTRVTEFKYLTGQTHSQTSVVYEYPQAEGDPFYPVPRPEAAQRYAKYKALAAKERDVHFVGRLANYQYFNMDQVVAQALKTFRTIAGEVSAAVMPAREAIESAEGLVA